MGTLASMPVERTIVFLPCHGLDDFPRRLPEAAADDLLAAWTASWHPALIAAVGGPPVWASVDLRPPETPHLGIVPATWDDRFALQADGCCTAGSALVRRCTGRHAIVREAVRALHGRDADGDLPGSLLADDFFALGLARLLAGLLARRMRSHAEPTNADFDAAVVTAALAAVAGRDDDARSALAEAFAILAATRARYYPVDVWLVDLVLLGDGPDGAVDVELRAPVPWGLVATADALARFARDEPLLLARLREAVAAGCVDACGGRDIDRPLDAELPETILASCERGRTIWEERLGRPPVSFARRHGGGSAMLPGLLSAVGYRGLVWSLFDGAPLPDPGAGLIRWEGGGGALDGIGRPPLDARRATTVLSLADAVGDALDRDHTAVIAFAHPAGQASGWHDLLRRIGGWSDLLGTFVTPATLWERAAGGGTPVTFEPDAFPPTLPGSAPNPETDAAGDRIDAAVGAVGLEASRVLAATGAVAALVQPRRPTGEPPPSRPAAERRGRFVHRLFRTPRATAERRMTNGHVTLEIHPRTGGLLSLRGPGDRGNRLSQQLAIRTAADDSLGDAVAITSMRADTIARQPTADGRDTLVARGALLAADGGRVARFTQRFRLAADLPLAVVEIDVELERPVAGPLPGNHLACRFAWNENEDVTVRRSVHAQAVDTSRSRFTAPHFIEIVPADPRVAPLTILTGGLPWHVQSSPHVLDSILAAGPAGRRVARRLAVGIGVRRPWDLALALAAGAEPEAGGTDLPSNVRLTVHDVDVSGGRVAAARIGLVESAGLAGEVRIPWTADVTRATVCAPGGGGTPAGHVAIEGRSIVVFLERYQWLHLLVEFAA